MSKEIIARYFEMWNSGDTSIAAEVLSRTWVDHAHPEISGPEGVRRAVESTRAAQPNLRFRIDAILADGDLVAAIGAPVRDGATATARSSLIWLVRMEAGRMAEMWTYRDTGMS